MPSPKVIGTLVGLTTSIGGIGSGIAYSLGAFHPSIQVSELIKKENKHVLLSSETTEWKATWDKYKTDNKPWGEITEGANSQVPSGFKDLCNTKIKESVYGAKDKKYEAIIKYCARKKTIKDVLDEVNFTLLATDGSGGETTVNAWKAKFRTYKASTDKPKLPDDKILDTDNEENDHTKLKDACVAAIKLETTVDNYANVLKAVREWCKA